MNYTQYYISPSDIFNTFETLSNNIPKQSYPPYNIVSTGEDSGYIEVACAGFSKDQIEVETSDGKIKISASMKDVSDTSDEKTQETKHYIKRGLAKRDFDIQFIMGKHIYVKNADLKDGILTINLERILPDELKPKKITLG